MTRILFTTLPMAGHIRPGLAVARELVAAGHEVLWYTGSKYRPLVTAIGARFAPFPDELDWADADLLKPSGGAGPRGDRWAPWRGIRVLERGIIDILLIPLPAHVRQVMKLIDDFRPDVIMAEEAFMAGLAAGELRGVPRVVYTVLPLRLSSVDTAPFGPGIAPLSGPLGRLRNRTLNWAFRWVFFGRAQRMAGRLRRALDLPPLGGYFMDWMLDLSDRVVHSSIPELEYPRRGLSPKVEFVGAMIPTGVDDWTPPGWWIDIDRARQDGRPIVVVTQGTLVTNPDNLIRPAIAGLACEGALVVVTTGGPDPAEVVPPQQRPDNLRIERFIPHTELLPLVDLMGHQWWVRGSADRAVVRGAAGRCGHHRRQGGGEWPGGLGRRRCGTAYRRPDADAGPLRRTHRPRRSDLPVAGAAPTGCLYPLPRGVPSRRSGAGDGGRAVTAPDFLIAAGPTGHGSH